MEYYCSQACDWSADMKPLLLAMGDFCFHHSNEDLCDEHLLEGKILNLHENVVVVEFSAN